MAMVISRFEVDLISLVRKLGRIDSKSAARALAFLQ